MAVYIYSHAPNWKQDKDKIKKEVKQICPRCNNSVNYELVWDSESIGIAGLQLLNLKKYYAFKCPICPNFEPLTSEVVKALRRIS